MVGEAGVEPTASWSRTKRATNCATPRYSGDHYTEFSEKCQGYIIGKASIGYRENGNREGAA